MRKFLGMLVLTMIATLSTIWIAYGDNPVVQTIYTADPAPLVHGDTVYLYTGHDEDGSSYFTMNEWMCYSSKDMVNWTDHGAVLDYKTFSWAKGDAWAAQCVERDGKFYYYVTITRKSGAQVIAVAVADNPTGPFTDPIGKPLVQDGWGDIDPTVFIDDDGQAYMYWGNPQLKYVKLNKDMISTDGPVVHVPLTHEGFGVREGNPDRETLYEEGPWLYKRNGLYYMLYAASGIPENIAYSTSKSPIGPWTYRGIIMPTQGSSFTNHPAVIDFKGKSYFVYHNGALKGGGGFTRSVCIEEFQYNEDGSFPTILMTQEGAKAISRLNPYEENEAETIAWSEGIETEKNSNGGMNVYDIQSDDYIKVSSVDFGKLGPSMFSAVISSEAKGGSIEIRLDRKDGELLGTLPVGYTGGYDKWVRKSTNLAATSGVHDVFFVFQGEKDTSLFKFDSWKFTKKSTSKELIGLSSSIDSYKIDVVDGNNLGTLKILALYSDGSSEDISSQAVITSDKPELVGILGKQVKGIDYGYVELTIQHKGFTDTVHVHIKDYRTEKIVKTLITDKSEIILHTNSSAYINVIAEYMDGHIEDVTKEASYQVENPELAAAANGVIRTMKVGKTNLNISYQGELGEAIHSKVAIVIIERNPYEQMEAEDYEDQYGVQVEESSETAMNVCFIEHGDWIKFGNVNFDQGSKEFLARVSSANQGGTLEVYLDTMEGEPIARCQVEHTGGWQDWVTVSATVGEVEGIHDIFLKFVGDSGYLFNLNWWQFVASEEEAEEIRSVVGIKLDITELTLNSGEKKTLLARVNPANASNKNVSWESSDSNIVVVDKFGLLEAKGVGTATLTVKTEDGGYVATCLIHVNGSMENDSEIISDTGIDNSAKETLQQKDVSKKNHIAVIVLIIVSITVIGAAVFIIIKKRAKKKKL